MEEGGISKEVFGLYGELEDGLAVEGDTKDGFEGGLLFPEGFYRLIWRFGFFWFLANLMKICGFTSSVLGYSWTQGAYPHIFTASRHPPDRETRKTDLQ